MIVEHRRCIFVEIALVDLSLKITLCIQFHFPSCVYWIRYLAITMKFQARWNAILSRHMTTVIHLIFAWRLCTPNSIVSLSGIFVSETHTHTHTPIDRIKIQCCRSQWYSKLYCVHGDFCILKLILKVVLLRL